MKPKIRKVAVIGTGTLGTQIAVHSAYHGYEVSAYDADFAMQKFNPLLEWSNKDVWAYIRQNDVPYNKLHDQFYPSIGCAPCTRSITPGEDIRAGRWWWENPEDKECGLHVAKPVILKRA